MRANMKICCSLSFAWALLWSAQLVSAQPQNDLDSARALWSSLTGNMPSNYTFQYTDTTMDGTPYVIDVRNDVVTRVYTLDIPAFDAPPIDTTGFPTVTDLFTLIQDTITDAVPDSVYEYNTKYGYPELISYSTGTDTVTITAQALTPYTILQKELEKNIVLWDSYGSLTDTYSYVTQVSCFCAPEYVTPKFIVVENTTIVSTVDLATMAPSDDTYDTLIELFVRVQQAIENFYVTIDVTYDATVGFVTSIDTNPEYLLLDAGTSIRVSEVKFPDITLEDTLPPTTAPPITSPPTTAPPTTSPPTTAPPTTSPPTTSPPTISPPTTSSPTLASSTRRWCFGLLKFNAWCRVDD